MKGQMFMVGVIVIVVALILMRNVFSMQPTIEVKRFEESSFFPNAMDNVHNELKNMVGFEEYSDRDDIFTNFSSLLREEKYMTLGYTYSYFNSSSGNFSVEVGNFFDDIMKTVVINATNSTPLGYSVGDISDQQAVSRNFTADINGTINVTVSYIMGESYTYKYYVEASSEEDYASGYFDVIISDDTRFLRRMSTYNRSWLP